MSIEDRITEILIDQWVPSEARYGNDEPVGFDSPRKWAAHVARVIVTELGITEQEGTDFTFGGQRRYVTPWENI